MSASASPGPQIIRPKMRSTMSDRIRIGRTLCIFLMTFVHVQPGIAENVYDRDAGFFDIVYYLLTRIVGLSSVALLSIVSGYLIVSTYQKLGQRGLYASKFQSLVVPLVVWNVLMLLLLAAYGALTGNWQDMPAATLPEIANALLAITDWPAVVPLWFLRDLFVCCLFAPLLLAGMKRSPVAVVAVLLVFSLFGEGFHLLERPQLMLFFGLGIWIRVWGGDEAAIDRLAKPLAYGLVAVVAVFLTMRIGRISIAEMNDQLRVGLDCALRITMAAAFWRLTELVRRSSFAKVMTRLEPYTFFLFCSHAILFQFGGILFRRVFGNYGSDLFFVTLFTLPLLAVVAAVVGLQAISWSKLLLYLFNAGHGVPPLVRRPEPELADGRPSKG